MDHRVKRDYIIGSLSEDIEICGYFSMSDRRLLSLGLLLRLSQFADLAASVHPLLDSQYRYKSLIRLAAFRNATVILEHLGFVLFDQHLVDLCSKFNNEHQFGFDICSELDVGQL